ncbi:MAG: RIP metalloprotease RseP [Defluviitaleaceae bacterium]|nr:RIP metalloprotease RseP [Defluviitaleaceae bacterium]
MNILIAGLIFGVIVLVHEYGHYIVAVKSGIIVEEFAIGMGPILYSKKSGNTLYSLRLLPIGGYCKMLGADEEEKKTLEGSYQSKSVFKRIAVIFAGSFMNFVLAFILILIVVGTNGYASLFVNNVSEDSPAYAAGLTHGDRIISINNTRMLTFSDIPMKLAGNGANPIDLLINRNGERVNLRVTPIQSPAGNYIIGFSPIHFSGLFEDIENIENIENVQRASIFGIIEYSFFTILYYGNIVLRGLIQLLTFNVSINDFSGPIGIVGIIGDSYEEALQRGIWIAVSRMFNLAALLSVNIGLFNLMPIPALDGARLIFLFIEALRGKPISPSKEGVVHLVGFVLLIGLILVVAFNDIMNLFR